MKATIVYDNEVRSQGLKAGRGFSAVIESENTLSILFDTGADSPTLLYNMEELGIDTKRIGVIVISHAHGDHTGGLSEILRISETVELFLPSSFRRAFPRRRVTMVKDAMQIREDVFSTGELEGVEQSLALKTEKGIFVVTGCAHPAMRNILGAAAKFGKLYGIAGGFHGFHDFKLFEGLSIICPCHCTQYKREILNLFPGKALQCGAGLELKL